MKIQEIAALAGVSTATVSRVFSHHPNVRREVREHVLAVAERHGYRPRNSGKQRNVVIIVPYKQVYPVTEYVDMVLAELMHSLARHHFRIELLPLDNLERLDEISFCAAIGIGIEVPANWRERFAMPLVIIDKIPTRKISGVSYVHSDERQGLELAISHLAERGCRKVGILLHGIPGHGNVDHRTKAAYLALKHNNLPADLPLVKATLPENFLEEMGKLLQQGIDGIFCGSGANPGGLAAYALALYGRKVPGDIRLVSSERHRISRYCIPPQTTISPDYEKLAETVAEQLECMLNREKHPAEIILPYSLIVRDST